MALRSNRRIIGGPPLPEQSGKELLFLDLLNNTNVSIVGGNRIGLSSNTTMFNSRNIPNVKIGDKLIIEAQVDWYTSTVGGSTSGYDTAVTFTINTTGLQGIGQNNSPSFNTRYKSEFSGAGRDRDWIDYAKFFFTVTSETASLGMSASNSQGNAVGGWIWTSGTFLRVTTA